METLGPQVNVGAAWTDFVASRSVQERKIPATHDSAPEKASTHTDGPRFRLACTLRRPMR